MDKHAKSFCQRFFSLEKVKNRANTNVLPLMNNNKVLCLFEGGSPYAVDKDNLSTVLILLFYILLYFIKIVYIIRLE